MRGREPNFELSEEEKQELRKFKWEEFLAITCHAITRKKYKRRLGAGSQRSECPFQNSDRDGKQEVNGHLTSEDMEWQARSQWSFDLRRYGARHICLLKTTFKNDTEFSSSNSKVLADRLQFLLYKGPL